MTITTIKITELDDIGADLDGETLLPVVNMTGTPVTEKAVLSNIANLILEGAGTDFSAVAVAGLAGTVTTAAQPNITSTGTLTALTVAGNISTAANVLATNLVRGTTVTALDQLNTANLSANGLANIARINVTNTANLGAVANVTITGGTSGYVLQTDGAGTLSWVAQSGGGSYGNSDVANYLPTFTGNVGASNVVATGNLFSAGLLSNGVANVNSNVASTNQNTGALKVRGGLGVVGNIHSGGEIHSGGNAVVGGQSLFVGPDADATGLTNPTIIAFHGGDTYIQAALKNSLSTGSADWVAYGDNGTDSQGWADFGFTSSEFDDPAYTITGAGDGYFFVETFAGSYGGNLVIATGSEGTVRDIIFATGGFEAADEFARISDGNNSFELTRTGASLTFPDGSVQTTAYTGGGSNPFNQDLNTTDNVEFANITSTDAIRFVNSGNVVGALGYAPTFVSIEGYQSNSVNITANDIYTWSFDNNGVLSKGDANGLVLAANYSAQIITDFGDNDRTWTFDGSSGELVFPGGDVLIDPTDSNFEVRGAENINFEANATVNIYTDTSNNGWQWQFGDDGMLTVPFEGVIRSIDDTIVLQSYDAPNLTSRSMRLGTNGGMYLEQTGLIPINNRTWLTIDPNLGNPEISASIGVVGSTAGGNLSIAGGAAEQTTYNTSPGGNVNITGGLGGSDDGGGGGPGGSVNITSGASADVAGHNGNVNINTGGSNNWIFDYTGNLTLPSNTFSVNYANGAQVSLGVNYGDSNVATFLASYGSNTITTTGNVSVGNIIGNGQALTGLAGANVTGTVANANLSQYLNVSDVNNNFSYHVVLSAGSGDKSLHIDADDNLQYNPNSGLLTAVRMDADYFVGDLSFSNGYPASNVVGLGNIATIDLTGSNSNVLYGNGTFAAPVAEASFSIQSANFNASAGSRYGVDTSGGAVTATLPASPATGAAIFFADAGGAYASNNLTIARNGQTIMGSSSDLTVSTNNQSVGLFYNGSTWRTYNAG